MDQLCKGLNNAAKSIHDDNRRKGFWEKEREIGTLLMLMVSELGEALDADRKGRHAQLPEDVKGNSQDWWFEQEEDGSKSNFEKRVKDSFEDEMADTVIRILDMCGAMGIDLEWHIKQKLEYNRRRAFKHGKSY